MTTTAHTPGPWQQDWQFIVAHDPSGTHHDIYIAEIAEADSDGRIAPPEQQEANGRLIVAAPNLLAACQMVIARWDQGDLAEAARACSAAVAEAEAAVPARISEPNIQDLLASRRQIASIWSIACPFREVHLQSRFVSRQA